MHLNKLVKDIVQDSSDIPKIEINNICTHSERAKNGSLFVAIYGEKFDGHDFIKKAVENGKRYNELMDAHLKAGTVAFFALSLDALGITFFK